MMAFLSIPKLACYKYFLPGNTWCFYSFSNFLNKIAKITQTNWIENIYKCMQLLSIILECIIANHWHKLEQAASVKLIAKQVKTILLLHILCNANCQGLQNCVKSNKLNVTWQLCNLNTVQIKLPGNGFLQIEFELKESFYEMYANSVSSCLYLFISIHMGTINMSVPCSESMFYSSSNLSWSRLPCPKS